MKEENRAFQAALKSREFVHTKDKEGWLGLFAEDGVIEDPIGKSPLDPEGNGIGTPEARSKFWDSNMANSNINITIQKSYTAANNEVANILTLVIIVTMDGKKYRQIVNGVFTYHVNDDDKITSLRGYWEFDEGLATFAEI